MSEKTFWRKSQKKRERIRKENVSFPGSAENPGRKSTTAAVLSGSVEKAGYVLHL